jgi:hypothetical protein
MYDGPFNSKKNDPLYRPARNVRKGMATDKSGGGKGSACNPDVMAAPADGAPLLRDNCFYTGTCPNMNGRMGDGNWNITDYWQRNYGTTTLPAAIAGANVSRYEVYLHELSSTSLLNTDSNGAPVGGELGTPGCYTGGAATLTDEPDRRIFYGAVLNCRALDTSPTYGPINGASGGTLPVVAFAKFFLTEPVGGSKTDVGAADGDVWAEMVDIVEPGTANSVARDIVQLYR